MAANQKPVILRRLSGDWLPGYANPRRLIADGQLELLDQSGKVLHLALDDVKMLSFVRDFAAGPEADKLARKTFAGRPRMAGVVVRIKFKDADVLEGLAANDATLLENDGLLLSPPDMRGNVQRIYVPAAAVDEFEVLSVIHPPKPRAVRANLQDDLFASLPVTSSRPN